MFTSILGVNIHMLSESAALAKVSVFLSGRGQHMVFTPNPEMLVAAHRSPYFKEVLNRSSLNICDGKGIEMFSKGQIERIPGVDFMLSVCALAEKRGKSVYLLGSGVEKIIEQTAKTLQKKYPYLRITGQCAGPKLVVKEKLVYDVEENDMVVDKIIAAAPDILFVGFGHTKQELWIDEHLGELPSVTVAMGVGGSFDILSGRVKRAPGFFRYLGLEWFWRLLCQPWRIKRILTAVFVFPYIYYRHK